MSSAPFPVTLQISLAPSDHRLVADLLNHQVEFWRPAVSEVLLVIDPRRAHGRADEEWNAQRRTVFQKAHSIPNARVLEVDYTREARHSIADEFFGGLHVPGKDWRGGPYFSYFYAMHLAQNDLVLHSDADMFFGGSGAPWLESALSLYQAESDLLVTAPLPGPPAPDGKLKQLHGTPLSLGSFAGYQFADMSTRVFLFSRKRFRERITALEPRPPALRERMLALLDGHPSQDLPENIIGKVMRERGLKRFDFAGPAPGCWTLHPPYRSEDFYRKLPAIIERVEKNDLPPAQLGDHDLNTSLIDWSEAHQRMSRTRWWSRLRRRLVGGDA